MPKITIGIMGPGSGATDSDLFNAYEIGKLSAERGYAVLTGGRRSGVMEAGLKGAKEAGGMTVAVLPYDSKDDATEYADIAIVTSMKSARNNINVISSDVVVACGIESGTLSEIALALKADKYVVIMSVNQKGKDFLKELEPSQIHLSDTPEDTMILIDKILHNKMNIDNPKNF